MGVDPENVAQLVGQSPGPVFGIAREPDRVQADPSFGDVLPACWGEAKHPASSSSSFLSVSSHNPYESQWLGGIRPNDSLPIGRGYC